MKEYVAIEGPNKGLTTVIMAGVHGDETCGIEAISKMSVELRGKISYGKVIFLIGNPIAVSEKKRFVDKNLGRMFRKDVAKKNQDSYEYHRSKFIMSVLANADAMLDIHSTKNKSKPFIISEHPNVQEITQNFRLDFENIVCGLDKLHPGSADHFMNSLGKIGISIECGQHEDEFAVFLAEETIVSFLKTQGHFGAYDHSLPFARKVCYARVLYKAKSDFTLANSFPDFTQFKKGKIIGKDGRKIIRAKQNCKILFAVNVAQDEVGREAFVLCY